MTKRQKLESLLGRNVVLIKHTHIDIKKEDNSLVEFYSIKNKLIDVPGTICRVTGTYLEVCRFDTNKGDDVGRISRCDYATKASKIEIFDKRGDIIGFEITEKSETNLIMLTDVLSYQVLSE